MQSANKALKEVAFKEQGVNEGVIFEQVEWFEEFGGAGPLQAYLSELRAVSSCTPTFFFLHPTMLCKYHIVLIIF